MEGARVIKEAHSALWKGDFTRAEELLAPLVAAEDADALYLRATFSLPKESREAFEKRHIAQLTRAAELGSPEAIYQIGAYHDVGDELPLDKKKAAELFRAAAAKGHLRSTWIHGVDLLAEIPYFEKDKAHGLELVEQAAEAGLEEALQTLVRIYDEGLFGIPANPEKAKRFGEMLEAASQSDPPHDAPGGMTFR
jgi:TPR repeat protein